MMSLHCFQIFTVSHTDYQIKMTCLMFQKVHIFVTFSNIMMSLEEYFNSMCSISNDYADKVDKYTSY